MTERGTSEVHEHSRDSQVRPRNEGAPVTVSTIESVRKSVTVRATQERAFEVFTAGFGDWWPLASHHTGGEEAVTAVVEPRAGGRWFERAASGAESDWGRVLVWEPPSRVVFAWHLDADFHFDPDPEKATEVEVRFVEDGDSTRVELEHRLLERFAARAPETRRALDGDGGWLGILGEFAKIAG